jgi:hypothetical protein
MLLFFKNDEKEGGGGRKGFLGWLSAPEMKSEEKGLLQAKFEIWYRFFFLV